MKKALIISHAHREKMPSELGQYVEGFQENLVAITEEGRLAARNVGKLISTQYDFITFSSVLRCNQTAAAINSYNRLKNIGESEYLVSEYFGNLNQLNEKEKQIAIDSLLNREDSLGLAAPYVDLAGSVITYKKREGECYWDFDIKDS